MMPTRQGSFRLFRLFGIDVHLHWSWLFVAIYSVSVRVPNYRSPVWALLEYLALFLIVLMHEYGHSLACRSVGGQADQIVLWPLGGVAYVSPPPRPGAVLWSIAAGPLVNVVLFPFLVAAIIVGERAGWETNHADLNRFIWAVGMVNALLLGFNLMPVYPLDGGQILRAVLWFFIGKARSLTVATVVGFLGGAVFVLYALLHADLWLGVLSLFLIMNCWRGFQEARMLRRVEQLPRRPEFACPVCRSAPPIGAYWRCQQCRQPFDPFASSAVCPHCGSVHAVTACPDCGQSKPILAWDVRVHDV